MTARKRKGSGNGPKPRCGSSSAGGRRESTPRVDSIDEINRRRVIEELGLHADEAGKRRRGRIAGDKHFAASMPGYSDMDKIP